MILDGTLLSIDRVGMASGYDRRFFSGEHKRHGVNVQVIADPAGRLALMRGLYESSAPDNQHLPYRRAAVAFMRWQLRRGVLEPLASSRPGSPWWRALNEGLIRDSHALVLPPRL